MSASLGTLEPWLQPWARWLIAHYPAGITITSTRRSRAKQTALYRRYLAGKHPYPVLPPGRSMHEYGRAWDMVTHPYSVLYQLGPIWRSVGGRWGGESDPIHFEAGPRPR